MGVKRFEGFTSDSALLVCESTLIEGIPLVRLNRLSGRCFEPSVVVAKNEVDQSWPVGAGILQQELDILAGYGFYG